ncbi:hypothetical protein SAMN05661012_05724 [Chitinophaga sancti]|nr:hypothetical protein SAMN05661012_05724 [Chitinophaga sancti]
MSNSADIEAYLQHLEKLYGRMVSFPSGRYYSGIGWQYSVSDCIDLIKAELDLKKSPKAIKLAKQKTSFSATDIANYEYCPASFAISNSFIIEQPSGEEFTETGKIMHEQLLAAKTTWQEEYGVDFSSNDLDGSPFRSSRLIFSGHQDQDRKFVNGNWVGVPDYIFQDKENNYFVVEEKFHYKRDPAKNEGFVGNDSQCGLIYDELAAKEAMNEQEQWSKYKGYFFSNHIVQVVSYIKNLLDYPIKYGYLLYWYYDKNNDEPYIHKVVGKLINLNDQTEALYNNAVNGVQQLKQNGSSPFQVDRLNMRKCAGCVVNKYCGHKTKRYSNLTFPYEPSFLNLFFATFPDELRKTTL